MQTQDEEQNKKLSQSYSVNTHHNQDKVLKESFNLFKGGSLDFLDTGLLGEVTEILNTEITETTTKKAYVDNALKMSTNKGVHQDLLILLTGSFVSDEELNKILEDNMRILEDSPAVRVLEDRGVRKGIQQGMEKIAKNMLRRGRNIQEISEDTGLNIVRITELQNELQSQEN